MKERVRHIPTDLERVREQLQGLSDDVWLRIDRDDEDSTVQGVQHVRTIREMRTQLNTLANKAAMIAQAYEEKAKSTTKDNGRQQPRQRIDLDPSKPYTLDDDFEDTRPYKFVFQGKEYEFVAWRRMFLTVCQQLVSQNPSLFSTLVNSPMYADTRGKYYFSHDNVTFIESVEIRNGIYAEWALSGLQSRQRLKRLLKAFGIDQKEIIIYLRERFDDSSEA